MTRMSVSSRPNRSGGTPGGFTLLELLIVLALMSIAAAVVAPRLARTYDAISNSGDRAEVERQLMRLPTIARRSGATLDFAPDQADALARALEVPAGWSVVPVDPIRVAASGICLNAARVLVRGPTGAETWALDAPACEVSDEVR